MVPRFIKKYESKNLRDAKCEKSKNPFNHLIKRVFCTPNDPILELINEDFRNIYALKDILENEGISLYQVEPKKLQENKQNRHTTKDLNYNRLK